MHTDASFHFASPVWSDVIIMKLQPAACSHKGIYIRHGALGLCRFM